MKYITIILLFVMGACEPPKEQILLNQNFSFDNAEVSKLITAYYKENIHDKGVVYLSFDQVADTTYLFISSRLEEPIDKYSLPSHYFFVESVPVVIRTGLEDIFTFDSIFLKNMKNDLNSYYHPKYIIDEDNGDTTVISINYNPVIWEVKLLDGHVLETKQIN